MTPDQRDRVIELLRAGNELDPEWQHVLFPVGKREYELIYGGKEHEEQILLDTMAVPLQAVRAFGRNGNGWHNKLILGDNLQVMKTLLALKEKGELVNADGSKGFRLIYIDPPFATKQEFAGSQEQKAYQDKVAGAEFLEFLRKRLVFMRELLADDGSIYVHLDTKKVHYVKVLMDEIFGEHRFVNEIIWKRTNARATPSRWPRIHDTLLYYSKSKDFLFNTTKVPADSAKMPHTLIIGPGGLKYQTYELTGQGVTKEGDSGKPWKGFNPSTFGRHWADSLEQREQWDRQGLIHWPKKPGAAGGFPRRRDEKPFDPSSREVTVGDVWTDEWADDVWLDVDRINQAAEERTGYPTQKPEALLSLIVTASSKAGDLVLDAFAGSGTTCAVAERLGRRWVGIDCGKLAIYCVQKRMLNLRKEVGNKGAKAPTKPFTFYNAGLYDFSKLRDLPWEGWRFFALNLFQCKDDKHKINGIELDGYLKSADVLVFDHFSEKKAKVTYDTIESLHRALNGRIGKKLFIIAPALSFGFQEDYVDRDGIRYYALRIPYSIINELHRRDFTAMRQPIDEDAVNDTVEAVGFDFIRTPDAKVTYQVAQQTGGLFEMLKIKITKFKSEPVATASRSLADMESLAMAMFDVDYDGDVFDLDHFSYAEQLKADKYTVELPPSEIGERIMLVLVDIYGNEYREVKTRQELGLGLKDGPPVEETEPQERPKRTNKKSTK